MPNCTHPVKNLTETPGALLFADHLETITRARALHCPCGALLIVPADAVLADELPQTLEPVVVRRLEMVTK